MIVAFRSAKVALVFVAFSELSRSERQLFSELSRSERQLFSELSRSERQLFSELSRSERQLLLPSINKFTAYPRTPMDNCEAGGD